MTRNKWIYCKIKEKLIPESEYRPPESKATLPEWIRDEPLRGHWKYELQEDGSFKAVEICKKESEYQNLFVHQDTIPPTEHPVTGEIFTSQNALDAANKRLGYEYYTGSLMDHAKPYEPPSPKNDIKEAIEKWKTPSWAEAERQRLARLKEQEMEDNYLKNLDEKMGYHH